MVMSYAFQADCINYGDSCVWYTYNNADLLCTMFSECQDFSDALCSDCVSGQPACIIEGDLPAPPDAGTTEESATTSTPAAGIPTNSASGTLAKSFP